MSRFSSHTLARLTIYSIIWVFSVILLGLTAYRVHVTESRRFRAGYEPIIVELLVTSILTMLWTPFALFMLFHDRFEDTFRSPRIHHEYVGLSILWLMWLVGAVTTTNQIIPGHNWCGPGKQCDILTAILAFAWINWSLMTILGILSLMNNAATGAFGFGRPATTTEKRTVV